MTPTYGCKHCGKQIIYRHDLQRWEHVHSAYDACLDHTSNRAEPEEGGS